MDELDKRLSDLAKRLGIQGAARLVKAAKADGITDKNLELAARAAIARSADKIFTAPIPSTGADDGAEARGRRHRPNKFAGRDVAGGHRASHVVEQGV